MMRTIEEPWLIESGGIGIIWHFALSDMQPPFLLPRQAAAIMK